MLKPVVLVRLTVLCNGTMKVVVRAVTTGAKAKTKRTSNNAALACNLSPPSFLFFIQIVILSCGNTKPIWSYLLEVCSVSHVESELLSQMNERIVKNFLDMLILIELKRGPLSDNELVIGLREKVGKVADSNQVDLNLSFLAKEGSITNRSVENKKFYALTMKGKEKVKAFLDSKNRILGLFLNLFI